MSFTINKAERLYLIERLEDSKDLCGFERKLLDRLKNSKCKWCKGNGYAPYVGGDDDELLCCFCLGTGFNGADQG